MLFQFIFLNIIVFLLSSFKKCINSSKQLNSVKLSNRTAKLKKRNVHTASFRFYLPIYRGRSSLWICVNKTRLKYKYTNKPCISSHTNKPCISSRRHYKYIHICWLIWHCGEPKIKISSPKYNAVFQPERQSQDLARNRNAVNATDCAVSAWWWCPASQIIGRNLHNFFFI